jgi:hypothetical protein
MPGFGASQGQLRRQFAEPKSDSTCRPEGDYPRGLHDVTNRPDREEHTKSWRDTSVVPRGKLRRHEAGGNGAADPGHHSFPRLDMTHVPALQLSDREDAGGVLVCVQIVGRLSPPV